MKLKYITLQVIEPTKFLGFNAGWKIPYEKQQFDMQASLLLAKLGKMQKEKKLPKKLEMEIRNAMAESYRNCKEAYWTRGAIREVQVLDIEDIILNY